ncbi:MAG: xylan 1,4-beta-xylosidase [Eubacteriaceae bacterium]|nr:xylan 1,4-beta-xylosidase [Eubacteriaceae bacterium]
MAKKKFKRFDVKAQSTESFGISAYIIVDKKTGVNYLFASAGYGGGLTPLLDKEGKAVVTNTADYAREAAEYEQQD